MIAWLTDPYAYDFMQRALMAALLVGVLSPLVGTWVVLGRLSYLGDAMGHATLSGVAVAYLAGWSIVIGALGAGLVMAVLMALLARHPRLPGDAVIGIVEVALFAVGIIIISRADSISVDLGHFLFGSITTVGDDDIAVNAALTLVAVGAVAALFGDLRAAAFDPLHARLVGVRITALALARFAALAIAVVVSLQTVGLLMSIAMLLVPAAAARLWSTTLLRMSLLACAIGVASATIGLTLAFHLGSAPGATIALTAVAALAVSAALTMPRRGRPPDAHAGPDTAPRPIPAD
jgi:ABC-type Mn2+/Zn2+ transport system permease subunit